MRREEARKHKKLIKAFIKGAEIQTKINGKWKDVDDPAFMDFEYRIKPKDNALQKYILDEFEKLSKDEQKKIMNNLFKNAANTKTSGTIKETSSGTANISHSKIIVKLIDEDLIFTSFYLEYKYALREIKKALKQGYSDIVIKK